jgi:hypothetical protein
MFHQHSSRFIRATLLVLLMSILCIPTPVIGQAIHAGARYTANTSPACTFFDDFSDNDAGWYTSSATLQNIAVVDGVYKWQLNRGESLGVGITTGVSGTECDNFHLEVDASVISTGYSDFKPNNYSLVFGNNYALNIYYDGTFALTKSYGNVILASGALPASFNAPPTTNRLFVNVYNGQIVVGANGVPYAFYTDLGYTSGTQGVGVEVFSAETHEVHFDNFSQTPGNPYTFYFLPVIIK